MRGLHWCLVVLLLASWTKAFPDRAGVWNFRIDVSPPRAYHKYGDSQVKPIVVSHTMFDQSSVNLDFSEFCASSNATYSLDWMMFYVDCYGTTLTGDACFNRETASLNTDCACHLWTAEELQWMNGTGEIDCEQDTYTPTKEQKEVFSISDCQSAEMRESATDGRYLKRNVPTSNRHWSPAELPIATSWRDGQYSVMLVFKQTASTVSATNSPRHLNVTLKVKDSRGHLLSTVDLPLLHFYLVMTILFIVFGCFWFVNMLFYRRDLLRIQYFIGLILFLEIIAAAMYYSVYKIVDGGSQPMALEIVALLISVAKSTLWKALFIMWSVGYGVIKMRLETTLWKLVVVCVISFILKLVKNYPVFLQNELRERNLGSGLQVDTVANLLVLCLMLGITVWIVRSVLKTYRVVQAGAKSSQKTFYSLFICLLVFYFVAWLAFMVWDMITLRFTDCIRDIRIMWIESGFWSILSSIILLATMILWRPSMNNERCSETDKDGDESAVSYTVMKTSLQGNV